jgi:hypothetical protein
VSKPLPNSILVAAVVLGPLVLALFAYSRPGYFNQTYLGGLLLFECLAASVWLYRRIFFALVIVAFLFAGVELPVGSLWTAARWAILGVGALVGSAIMLRDRKYRIGWFHVLAMFAVLAGSGLGGRFPVFEPVFPESPQPVDFVHLCRHRSESRGDGP